MTDDAESGPTGPAAFFRDVLMRMAFEVDVDGLGHVHAQVLSAGQFDALTQRVPDISSLDDAALVREVLLSVGRLPSGEDEREPLTRAQVDQLTRAALGQFAAAYIQHSQKETSDGGDPVNALASHVREMNAAHLESAKRMASWLGKVASPATRASYDRVVEGARHFERLFDGMRPLEVVPGSLHSKPVVIETPDFSADFEPDPYAVRTADSTEKTALLVAAVGQSLRDVQMLMLDVAKDSQISLAEQARSNSRLQMGAIVIAIAIGLSSLIVASYAAFTGETSAQAQRQIELLESIAGERQPVATPTPTSKE